MFHYQHSETDTHVQAPLLNAGAERTNLLDVFSFGGTVGIMSNLILYPHRTPEAFLPPLLQPLPLICTSKWQSTSGRLEQAPAA
jgi:hypothetical protein